MKRMRINNVDLREPVQEDRHGQQTSHNTLRIPEATCAYQKQVCICQSQGQLTGNITHTPK